MYKHLGLANLIDAENDIETEGGRKVDEQEIVIKSAKLFQYVMEHLKNNGKKLQLKNGFLSYNVQDEQLVYTNLEAKQLEVKADVIKEAFSTIKKAGLLAREEFNWTSSNQ